MIVDNFQLPGYLHESSRLQFLKHRFCRRVAVLVAVEESAIHCSICLVFRPRNTVCSHAEFAQELF